MVQGSSDDAPRRLQGAKGVLAGAAHEILCTTKRDSENLTCLHEKFIREHYPGIMNPTFSKKRLDQTKIHYRAVPKKSKKSNGNPQFSQKISESQRNPTFFSRADPQSPILNPPSSILDPAFSNNLDFSNPHPSPKLPIGPHNICGPKGRTWSGLEAPKL